MSPKDLIPPSPSDADYAAHQGQASEVDEILPEGPDPLSLFTEWLQAATRSEPNDPNAMALATVDAQGMPDARMVLLKGVEPEGFVFYTNLQSAKGEELAGQPMAALLFHWKSLRRQVRVRGPVEPVSEAEADAYFASRARSSQIGAWASAQSRELPDRFALQKAVAEYGL
jgi:pyridoxamine 5'-phosphate oxidase